jgi:hypothetical protein
MAAFIRVRLAGVGCFGELGILEDDTIARVTDRACAKFPSWRADAAQLHLYLVADGGDDEPSDDAASAALSGGTRLGAGWTLKRAGVPSGAWLVARVTPPHEAVSRLAEGTSATTASGGGGGAGAGSAPVAEVAAMAQKVKTVEVSVKAFSTKLGADVEAWQKQMNEELQAAASSLREAVKCNHEEVSAQVAVIGKKVKAVEESVKSFSTKLGADVEAWQQAINTELQSALSKVKEQVHKNAEVVGKCLRDVEAVAAGRAPSPHSPKGEAGEPCAPVADAAAFAAMAKRIKVLEATLSAHEMALEAHTQTLEAHASWLENIDGGMEEEGAAEEHAAPFAAAPAAAAAAPAAA